MRGVEAWWHELLQPPSLPMALPLLVLPIAVALGRSWVVSLTATTEVPDSLSLAAKVG